MTLAYWFLFELTAIIKWQYLSENALAIAKKDVTGHNISFTHLMLIAQIQR
jgi:hypothetical protein